jgi:hypothetical protein
VGGCTGFVRIWLAINTLREAISYREKASPRPQIVGNFLANFILVVRLEGETSNTLFEILEDWEDQLKVLDLPDLELDP